MAALALRCAPYIFMMLGILQRMEDSQYNIHIILLCFFCCGLDHQHLVINWSWPISFRVASQALGQSHDCPSASEADKISTQVPSFRALVPGTSTQENKVTTKISITYWAVRVRAHSSGGRRRRMTSSVTSSGQELTKLSMAEQERKQTELHTKWHIVLVKQDKTEQSMLQLFSYHTKWLPF